MANPLNLFPARVPIGRATGADGRSVDVMMTREFANALSDLLVRVGGPSSINLGDMAALFASEPVDTTGPAALRAVVDLTLQLATAERAAARVAGLERRVEELARLVSSSGPVPVDWEHPGKIGAATPNTAQFKSVNRVEITAPITKATFTLLDGKTFKVTDSVTLSGNDGATLNVGAGGTLGAAAYKDTTAFASSSNTALPAAATDAASTQALANAIRSILLAVRIGT